MIKTPALFAAFLIASTSMLSAQSTAPAPTLGKAAPTAAPSVAATVALAVDDLETLRGHLNETVDVRGTPTATGHSKSGTVTYLNFGPAHRAVAVVAFLGGASADPAARKVQSEDDLKPFVGKPVTVHGKLADYKGDLQIVLDSLDQIKLAP